MQPISLESWKAWAPGIESQNDWVDFFKDKIVPSKDKTLPKNSYIPPNIKRRCSSLSKLTLYGALRCSENASESNINSVFVSRYGEMETTISLLNDISQKELLSPFGFSHSVHNTSAGLYSIISKNPNPSVSISGGNHAFCYGFIETLKFLNKFPKNKVMLVISDESLPDPFNQDRAYPQFPYVFAFLFSLKEQNLAYSFSTLMQSLNKAPIKSDVFLFFKWLLLGNDQLELNFNQSSLLIKR